MSEAGFRVTLVGGTRCPRAVRDVVHPRVRLALFPLPSPGSGKSGQVREQAVAFVRAAGALLGVARSRAIDVVHSANPPDNVWLILPLLRLVQERRPLYVFDQHDVAPVLLTEKFGEHRSVRALHRLALWLERRSFERSDLVVFASAEYEVRARGLGLLRCPGAVVPNGWDLPAEGVNGSPWRREGSSLVAYVGAIGEQDHVDHLVDAIATIRGREHLRVVVAGDGCALGDVKKRTRERGVDNVFTFLGWVRHRQTIASLVHSADVCVVPEVDSAFNRLASLVKLVEYMSAGRPIAAHRLRQTEAIAGDTISYADDMTAEALGRAVERLIDDRDEASRLGVAARSRFEESVAWPSVGAKRLVHAYAELARRP